APPHTDLRGRLELPVDRRRDRPASAVLAEFAGMVDRRIPQLRELAASGADPEVDSQIWGRRPLFRLLPVRIFDLWTHEQDIRRATGRPGGLDSPGAAASCRFLTKALPFMVGRAGLPDGAAVRFEVTGEQEIHQTVGDGTPAVTVRMDWETFARLAGGRVAPDQAKVTASGDPEQGRQGRT